MLCPYFAAFNRWKWVVLPPSSLPTLPFPMPSPQSTPEALPYPILRRLSSTSESRAVGRSGGRPRPGENAFWNSYTSLPDPCAPDAA